ncbi:MAG: FAD-dependent oxidoreductase, partial [Candidatus Hydrogenedentota bacterium]
MSHVIIVGAGPAGASLTFVMAKRGIDVTLLERQQYFAR